MLGLTCERPGQLTLEQLRSVHAGGGARLQHAARERIRASAAVVQRAAAGDAPVYGVNTGFGKLANQRISDAQLDTLQLNLIRSHSVGVGEPLAPEVVRLMLALKAASLARGYSGVRELVVDTLLAVHNAGLVPYVPAQGSVGASGDLAPLAHMTLALMGEGEMLGRPARPALAALQTAGIAPLTLQAKEGLALINGTQTSTALALHALFGFEPVLEAALVVGALTVDAARGSDGPFDPRIHALRGQPGQIDVAQVYRALLAAARYGNPTRSGDDRVQDPYCLRCQPQVVGACVDHLRHAARVLLREANAVTDNPLVFAAEGALPAMMISGGNFHAEPVALAADGMALAIAEVGAIAERRIAMLIDRGVAPAALPDGRRRAEQRLHDRPRHRRGAGQREQVDWRTRPASTACPPAPTRKTTSAWPPSPRAGCSRDPQHRAHPRHRVAGRGAGHRILAAADEFRRAGECARLVAQVGARNGTRPLPRARHRGGHGDG